MTKIAEMVVPASGLLGHLHEIEFESKDSVLIFQLPRYTKDLSKIYIDGTMDTIRKLLPDGRQVMFIGCDVNIYEIAGSDMVALKLKGLV